MAGCNIGHFLIITVQTLVPIRVTMAAFSYSDKKWRCAVHDIYKRPTGYLNVYLHSLKAYSNSSRVLGNVKGGSSFFISSSKSILDSKSEEKKEKVKVEHQFVTHNKIDAQTKL